MAVAQRSAEAVDSWTTARQERMWQAAGCDSARRVFLFLKSFTPVLATGVGPSLSQSRSTVASRPEEPSEYPGSVHDATDGNRDRVL